MANFDQRRRQWLVNLSATAASVALASDVKAVGGSFSFVHITDTHIQPELGAEKGVAKAFAAVRNLPEKPDFALVGGDIVMDANLVDRKRCELIYGEWAKAAASLKMPIHYSIGNHDAFAIGGEGKLNQDNPEYGKKWWQKRLGLMNRYAHFDHKGWRFIVLDSVQLGADGSWWGEIDREQITWLDDLLRNTPTSKPIVMLTHIPLMTIHGLYTRGTNEAMGTGTIVKNGKEIQELIQRHNVKAVLQGHTHVVEECTYLGTRYITGGAVSGEWWKGPRLGVHPEGFGVIQASANGDFQYRYVPYGWKAVPG